MPTTTSDTDREFVDNANRTWRVEIHALNAGAIRRELGLDLLDATAYLEKLTDPVRLVEVLFVLLDDQITAARLSPEEFARGLTGDALVAATRALWHALASFVPSKKGAILRDLWKRLEISDAEFTEHAAELIASADVSADVKTGAD
jgi:hypothetical protein